ncbi:hypothetical protein J2847_005877 [Azospirillum agricola]|uniref:hypothetical protein n=1 Tax=Azospirillum agricola TaxID=1720247 RepID=UPI001AE4EBB3|nr:hypothetical protein [Azospirillum agricola]MBP2232548.1 hypothetical protein [Azospirillum agricola]
MRRALRLAGAFMAAAVIVVGDLTSGRLMSAIVDASLLACVFVLLVPMALKPA